jgi:hypothetical protein
MNRMSKIFEWFNVANDSVGFIKMRLDYDDDTNKINEVWELQRWHVIKYSFECGNHLK